VLRRFSGRRRPNLIFPIDTAIVTALAQISASMVVPSRSAKRDLVARISSPFQAVVA
jgi:hypothetical protein